MNNEPLVSVIVPVYNIEKYVRKCLDSLTSQSYENIEIIVVDDGSTDGSGEICDEIASKDKRVEVFHKKNGGLSSARNYGIKKAKGEYVCLVDGDDYVKRDFAKIMMEGMDRGDVDIVVCGYNAEIPKAGVMSGKEATIRLLTQQENVDIIAWNKMYRRCLFDKIQYPEGQNYEDSLTTYKLLAEARNVAYVAESLYVYVERGGSITKNDKKDLRLAAREKAAEEAVEYFAWDKELKAAAEVALLTAKLAFVDFAISGAIGKEYGVAAREWIRKNAKKYDANKFVNRKLRIYIKMICCCGGVGYTVFRRIRHE